MRGRVSEVMIMFQTSTDANHHRRPVLDLQPIPQLSTQLYEYTLQPNIKKTKRI